MTCSLVDTFSLCGAKLLNIRLRCGSHARLHDHVCQRCALQVYDLREFRPGPVLQRIYANLAAAIEKGDKVAAVVRR